MNSIQNLLTYKGRDIMKKTFLLFIVISLIFACGKKEIKPVSQESKTSMEAFTLAATLKDAFTSKDLTALQKNSTEDGYKDLTANRKPFDTVELNFTPRWVEIADNKVMLNVSWKSKWTASGKSTEDRGMGVFSMEGTPLKLTKILMANPFVFREQ